MNPEKAFGLGQDWLKGGIAIAGIPIFRPKSRCPKFKITLKNQNGTRICLFGRMMAFFKAPYQLTKLFVSSFLASPKTENNDARLPFFLNKKCRPKIKSVAIY
ncbi:MAG: hypothetical protein MUC59_11915 [Saprospiraceae bacterium]|jgi:hypothetical protein|nr:hypothetical protein [Saprospiraceae bacterium]